MRLSKTLLKEAAASLGTQDFPLLREHNQARIHFNAITKRGFLSVKP